MLNIIGISSALHGRTVFAATFFQASVVVVHSGLVVLYNNLFLMIEPHYNHRHHSLNHYRVVNEGVTYVGSTSEAWMLVPS